MNVRAAMLNHLPRDERVSGKKKRENVRERGMEKRRMLYLIYTFRRFVSELREIGI